MSGWELFFLGVMAASLAVLVIGQVVLMLALIRAARQVTATIADLQRDVRPLIEKATRVADDAARVTSLAVAQAERIDELVTTTAARVEDTFSLVQRAVIEPIRQGSAILAGVKAAIEVVRAWQRPPSPAGAVRDDDDPLFVG